MEAPIELDFAQAPPPVHFVRLSLLENGRPVSSNVYWRGTVEGDFRALRSLPKTRLSVQTKNEQRQGRHHLVAQVTNTGASPALLVRIQALGSRTRGRILPATISDSYFTLMPGESRQVSVEAQVSDCRGENPEIKATAFNQ